MNHRQKYLDILGLPLQATEQEIKKKYRKLVFIYHPDKNNGDNLKFIAITEAYDVLMGRKAPSTSVQRQKSSSSAPQSKTAEDRVKEARQRFQKQAERERDNNLRFFRKITSGIRWKIIRWSALVGGLVAFVILLDFCLPNHYEQTRLASYSEITYGSFSGKQVCVIRLENGEEYFASDIDYNVVLYFPEILIRKSWIFHNSKELLSIQGTNLKTHGIHFNFSTAELLVLAVSLLPVLTYFYKRPTINFTIIYYLSTYFSAAFLVYYLLTNDRWAHLLTFGFL